MLAGGVCVGFACAIVELDCQLHCGPCFSTITEPTVWGRCREGRTCVFCVCSGSPHYDEHCTRRISGIAADSNDEIDDDAG